MAATKAADGAVEMLFVQRDAGLAIGVVGILMILFLPLPAFLIDLGLAFSIALSMVILMVALWIRRPLEFSAFPTVLLIATLLRLSLNVATTRLILSQGAEGPTAAGHVIAGFAQFVMGGDFVIGIIVFIILVTVNFVVITKGATRIAEVGARFTLDSLPGKQMAVDADLSSGAIDEKEAIRRRRELEEESQFFGAMDGASKFVRGDAIAGLIITAVNIFGGIIIGVTRHDLPFERAVDTFTNLSVGDGLVTQMPALIVSLAAGLLVSKGGTQGSTEGVIISQFGNYPRALLLAGSVMAVLALAPGLPLLPFAAIAGILFSGLLVAIMLLFLSSVPRDALDQGMWLSTSRDRVVLATGLMPFAGVAFLWFIGVLRDRLGHLEDRFFATVFFGSALLFLAMLFTSAATIGAIMLVASVSEPNEWISSTAFRFARAASYIIMNVYAIKMAAVFMISTSTVVIRTGIVPRWIALLGFLLALVLLIGSSFISWSFAVLPVWVLLISVYILIDNLQVPGADRALD